MVINKPPEFRYPIMEHFHSIQGEGYHSGKSAYFIRLGGCDVGCHWCDVKESWDMDGHPKINISELLQEISKYKFEFIVVTGGEPLMYDLSELTFILRKKGYKLHLETSGAYPLTGLWDWICLSPKKNKKPVVDIFSLANELKMVIFNKSDFEWAEENRKKVKKECKLFLQPEWGKKEKIQLQIMEYQKKHLYWRFSMQIHKYLGVR